MKRMKGGFFFPWLHSSMIYLIVYKKIAYYIQQLLPTPRGWPYFTFGREVKIRRGVILSLGVVEHVGISYTRSVDFIACLGAFGFAPSGATPRQVAETGRAMKYTGKPVYEIRPVGV